MGNKTLLYTLSGYKRKSIRRIRSPHPLCSRIWVQKNMFGSRLQVRNFSILYYDYTGKFLTQDKTLIYLEPAVDNFNKALRLQAKGRAARPPNTALILEHSTISPPLSLTVISDSPQARHVSAQHGNFPNLYFYYIPLSLPLGL